MPERKMRGPVIGDSAMRIRMHDGTSETEAIVLPNEGVSKLQCPKCGGTDPRDFVIVYRLEVISNVLALEGGEVIVQSAFSEPYEIVPTAIECARGIGAPCGEGPEHCGESWPIPDWVARRIRREPTPMLEITVNVPPIDPREIREALAKIGYVISESARARNENPIADRTLDAPMCELCATITNACPNVAAFVCPACGHWMPRC